MAGRIRTIKPEILEDERSAGLSSDAWRLWVSMWLIADDFGNLRGDSRRLAATVFWCCPDPVPINDLLEELESAGVIGRYAVRGQRYVNIRNWAKHQRIDNASTRGRLDGPEMADDSLPAETRRESPRAAETRGSSLEREGRGEDSHSRARDPGSTYTGQLHQDWLAASATTACDSSLLVRLAEKCSTAARAMTPPADPNEYARRAFAAFAAWRDGIETPARRPAFSLPKFLQHFERIERIVAGLEEAAPPKQALQPKDPRRGMADLPEGY